MECDGRDYLGAELLAEGDFAVLVVAGWAGRWMLVGDIVIVMKVKLIMAIWWISAAATIPLSGLTS